MDDGKVTETEAIADIHQERPYPLPFITKPFFREKVLAPTPLQILHTVGVTEPSWVEFGRRLPIE
ncbi:MAG: hypothetical protein AAFX78_13875 [Cyanobacteria bacterium J06638_20]